MDETHLDDQALAGAIAALEVAYPRQQFPQATATLYARMLADLDGVMVAAAVKNLIRTSKFLPSIAEIREQVAEAHLGLPTEQEAWALATSKTPRALMPPEVVASMDAVGGRHTIMHDDHPAVIRAQFRDDYNSRRQTAVRREVTGELIGPVEAGRTDLTPHTVPALVEAPESEKIVPRPVYRDFLQVVANMERTVDLDELRADAIDVLRDSLSPDLLARHAQRILAEASA